MEMRFTKVLTTVMMVASMFVVMGCSKIDDWLDGEGTDDNGDELVSYTVSYVVEEGTLNQYTSVSFDINIHLSGDVRSLRNADQYGYYIKYSDVYEYHSVQSLNPIGEHSPYTYTLTVENEKFQTIDGVKVVRGFYIGFYVVTDKHTPIGYYDEQEIEDLVYPNEGDWVDLGLPSGLLWATRNVGATSLTDYGNYYAWGETTPKSKYNWSTYRYSNGDEDQLTKYCNIPYYGYNGFTDTLTILQYDDDAATANYGGRTPTKEEWQELINNTTSQWMALNGVNGRCFTGSNGKSLFLPATGNYWSSSLSGSSSYGYYWSSSLNMDYPYDSWSFYFSSDNQNVDYYGYYRSRGFTVRAVR